MKHTIRKQSTASRFLARTAVIMLTFVMCFTCIIPIAGDAGVYAASVQASGKIDASGGACMRSKTSTDSKQIMLVKDNASVTVIQEVFNSKSTKASGRWYLVSYSGKQGYIRSDLVDITSYANISAKTTAKVNYRTGPSSSMKKKGSLKRGASLVVLSEAKLKSSSAKWYRVKISGKAYYISAKYVKLGAASSSASTSKASAPTAGVTVSGARVPVCIEAGKGFTIKGVLKGSDEISTVKIGVLDSKGSWVFSHKYDVDARSFDILSVDRDVAFGKLTPGTYTYRVEAVSGGKTYTPLNSKFEVTTSALLAGLKGNPTNGGKARYVYTFDTTNCTKLFGVSGFSKAVVPQGMTFTGSEYYIVYGMKPMQAIVTYSQTGEKLKSGGFAFNMGHPNGITWDPKTGLCYIFKGNQKTIYTWNPKTNKYGKAKTPYSSSGVAYDGSTNYIYATSQTGVRVYSSDGKFKHQKLFKRCSHGIKHYIQDCGAGGGFVFHGISGSNKQKTNFLDVYRSADGMYLGSIRIAIGEIESVVVGNDGYVQLLVNTSGKTDYVWKTPLNINDLK